MSKYNGHPSYEHWNVALWFGNDEGLYLMARECADADSLIRSVRESGMIDTPDDVYMSDELLAYAWESVQDE